MTAELDHLVVACLSLAETRPVLEAALGATDQGGVHPGRGTHNALWSLSSAHGPCYLELIAPDPSQPPAPAPMPFALHREDQLARLASGPRLIAWVARTDDAGPLLARSPVDLGALRPMSRGPLSWRLSVPPDGVPPLYGAIPSLIEWPEGASPALTLPPAGLRLLSFTRRPDPEATEALDALGLAHLLPEDQAAAPLRAEIEGPNGRLTLT